MVTQRSREICTRLESRVSALEAILTPLTEDQWHLRCEGEGWSVGLVGCHVGLGLRRQARWIERALAGGVAHDFSWERTHALNALVKRRALRLDPDEVLRSLRDGLERWRRLLEALTEADLSRIAFRMGPNERSVDWVAGALAVRHVDEHTRSIRTALGDAAAEAPPREQRNAEKR